jgi:hypothetical protein
MAQQVSASPLRFMRKDEFLLFLESSCPFRFLNVNSGFLYFGFNLILKAADYRGKLSIFLPVPDSGLIFE